MYKKRGCIWNDENGDGVQNAAESGISGVTVRLYQDTSLVETTATDANGNYSFTGLIMGTYRVVVSQPVDSTQTGDPDGTPDNETTVTLAPGITNNDADFGYQLTNQNISGQVYEDYDNDGLPEDYISNVTIDLLDMSDNVVDTTATGADGLYTFTAYPGNYKVRIDSVTLPTRAFHPLFSVSSARSAHLPFKIC